MEGLSTSAVGYALIKYLLGNAVATSISVALGFLIIKPRTGREAMVRIFVTLLCSFMFGPLLVTIVHANFPSIFDAARQQALSDGFMGMADLYVSIPLIVLAGLPAWWILGWVMHFLDNRKAEDLGNVVNDIMNIVDRTRGIQGSVAVQIQNSSTVTTSSSSSVVPIRPSAHVTVPDPSPVPPVND